MILPGFGVAAQERLAGSRALVVGCGALGCAAVDLLARAGVGTLTLVDRDVVEVTNLQRQSLYVDADARAGVPKAEAAKRRVLAIDPALRVHACVEHLSAENAEDFVRDCDVVVDGLDNYRTRYLLNDAAVKLGKPFIHAGAVARGSLAGMRPGHHPCRHHPGLSRSRLPRDRDPWSGSSTAASASQRSGASSWGRWLSVMPAASAAC